MDGRTADDGWVEDKQRRVRVIQIKKKRNIQKDSPSTGLCVLAPVAVTLPSMRHINHQHLVLRLDKRPLADTKAAGLCLLVAVCPAGGRGAGAERTREAQHHLIKFLLLVVKVVVMMWLCQLVLRVPKKGQQYFCGGDFGELCRCYYLYT